MVSDNGVLMVYRQVPYDIKVSKAIADLHFDLESVTFKLDLIHPEILPNVH